MSIERSVTVPKARRLISEKRRTLVLEAVTERDIDLLLVEELIASVTFQRLVFDAVPGSGDAWKWIEPMAVTVLHSVPHSGGTPLDRVVPPSGETDIEVRFENAHESGSQDDTRLVLLIENKIGAAFMPRQPQRYLARAMAHVKSGECAQARAMIVAPAEYLASVAGVADFHGALSYEQIAEHFADRARIAADSENAEIARRYLYRKDVLEHAINRYRREYRTVTHPGVKAFRHAYHAHVERVAPGLRLQPQNPVHHWEGDVWMEYRRALEQRDGLRCDIVHKCPHGRVDLQLYGWAEHESILRSRLESMLEPGMYVPPVNPGTRSLMVTIPAPAVIPQKPFKKQIWAAELGIRAAERLQDWYHKRADALAELAASVRLDGPVA